MALEREIRRLRAWNSLFLTVLVAAAMLYGAGKWFQDVGAPRVHRVEPGRVRISSISDGPYIVTHLVTGRVDS